MNSQIYCTNCGKDFIVVLLIELDGNHEIICPMCKHVHYRVIKNSVVTGDRWQSTNGPVIKAAPGPTLRINPYATSPDLRESWLNRDDMKF